MEKARNGPRYISMPFNFNEKEKRSPGERFLLA